MRKKRDRIDQCAVNATCVIAAIVLMPAAAFACSPSFGSSDALAEATYGTWPLTLLIASAGVLRPMQTGGLQGLARLRRIAHKTFLVMTCTYGVLWLLEAGVYGLLIPFKIPDLLLPGYFIISGFFVAVASWFLPRRRLAIAGFILSAVLTTSGVVAVEGFDQKYGGMWISGAVDCSNPNFYPRYPYDTSKPWWNQ